MREQFNQMLTAWTRGDVNGIAKTFNADMASTPAMLDALLKRRNRNWTQWIERRLETPGTVMMAVGAGHLAGQDSVLSMLEKSGRQVRRLQ